MATDQTTQTQPTYHSYLLRLWRADNAGQPVCRASLEAPGSYTQIHFESLAALYAYLVAQVGISDDVASIDEAHVQARISKNADCLEHISDPRYLNPCLYTRHGH